MYFCFKSLLLFFTIAIAISSVAAKYIRRTSQQSSDILPDGYVGGTNRNLGKVGANNESNIPPDGYISYGMIVQVGKAPWMTSISLLNDGSNYVFRCGGSLISDKHVLTAAHCLKTAWNLQDVIITVGDYIRSWFPVDCDSDSRCALNHRTHPASVTLHYQYNRGNLNNDIAMLRLEKHVNTDLFQPISLPPFDIDLPEYENEPLAVVGWGYTESSGNRVSDNLLVGAVNLKTRQECHKIYNYAYPEGHLCAATPNNTRSNFCKGDSGGPLVMYYKNQYYVSGIISFIWKGQKCGENKATYSTNVFKYMEWINWAKTQ